MVTWGQVMVTVCVGDQEPPVTMYAPGQVMVTLRIGDPRAVRMRARGQEMVTSGREWVAESARGQVVEKCVPVARWWELATRK